MSKGRRYNVGVLLILDDGVRVKKHVEEVEVYTMRSAEMCVENLLSFYRRDGVYILKNIWIRDILKPPIGHSEPFQV